MLYNAKKRILSVIGLIIAAAMIISSCDAVTGPDGLANGAAALSVSRSKVQVVPTYHITTVQDLIDVNNDPSANYVLENDLTLDRWIPICDPSTGQTAFTGTFNGQGNTITVNSFDARAATRGNYLGIFAVIGGDEGPSSVANLNVRLGVDAITTSAQYVGGLVAYTRDAAFSNIAVTGRLNVTQDLTTVASFNVGGVAGFAASSTFTNVKADIAFTTLRLVSPPPTLKWEIWRGDDTFRVRSVIDTVTVTGEDGVTTGGVAGLVKFSQFRTVTVTGSITATGQVQGTPVYAGGVLGYANGATVDNSRTNIVVIGNGPGYNTSGGGVAGYVINTAVRDSYAEGPVDLSGPSDEFGWDYSWQVYAGGLVGYAGGSDAAPSLVDHSHASGSVYAYAPFPYAGGLVGYLYGYNDFASPAKNGSTVSRSYATGPVSAAVQTDTVENYGDIPYAGGLVGYSSVVGSTIADSYATGSASATTEGTFAWAGGIVGGNANDAVVLRTYATGNVSSRTGSLDPLYPPYHAETDTGPAVGGIAGFNYYSAATLVGKSVALNITVKGNQSVTQDVVHRVAGSLGTTAGFIGTLDDNYANKGMTVGDNWQEDKGLDEVDGADVESVPSQALYAGLGWDFAGIWQMAGTYPTLR
jgi:hypothetical protein